MMKLILAHCTENQMVAAKIASALNSKATVEKVVFDMSNGMEGLRKATYSSPNASVLLLISDNFLKSEKCMNDALLLIQSLGAAQRLITVTTEGIYQENGRPVILPTSFDRVSNVIQYMNYWQDRYLDLRRKKPEGDETAFNEKVRVVRTISSEIGELLRYLRSTEYYSYDQFEDSNFIVLFRVLGIQVTEEMAIATHVNVQNNHVHHTAMPTEAVVAELEPEMAGESSYNPFANGIHFGSKNSTTETNNYLETLMGDDEPAPSDPQAAPTRAETTVSEAADKMKELATNGVAHMKEVAVEQAPEAIVDNLSPTSDFQMRANELINDGLDRPSSLESLIAGMRVETTFAEKPEISDKLSRQVDAILETETAPSVRGGFGGLTLEQILKDGDLAELVKKEGTSNGNGEALLVPPTQNGTPTDIAPPSSNGNGQHLELDDTDSDLVKQIAAEAEREFQEKMRLKAEAEAPIKAEEIAPKVEEYTPVVAEPLVIDIPAVAEIENFAEKSDADFRDLTETIDVDEVKSEVTRIFDQAEEPAVHFEFEENINDKLTEETAALFDEPVAPKAPEKIVNKLVIERAKPAPIVAPVAPVAPIVENIAENIVDTTPIAVIAAAAATLNWGKNDPEVAQILLDEAEAAPSETLTRYQLAAELAQQSRLTEATEQLEILLETDRKNVEAYVLLAYLAEQQGDHTLSLNSLEKVALLNPDYPGIYYKLGQLTKEHFKKQSRKALRYFQDAVAQDPTNADAQYRLGMMLIEQKGEHATAIEHFLRATESAPQHDGAAFELAKAFVETGNQKSAAAFYARATELNGAYKTAENDVIFFYEEPKPEPIVEAVVAPTVNDNGITVMITGATAGIGMATAAIFAQNGYRLILTGRRNDRLEDIKADFESTYNNRIQILNFDVRSLEGIKTAVSQLEEDFKNVDILINNAGLAAGLSPIHEGDVKDWEVMIDTNIKGLLYVTRAVAPSMVARKKGHIINLSSIAGKEIYPNGNVYIATKHAVDALTKAMRVDLHKFGIRVSQVAPGAVEETEFALVRFHGDVEKAKIYDEFTPLKASDVAKSIYFIATQEDYVNIQDIVLAGTQQAAAAFVDRSGRKDK
jgi:NADP-dependent 3-hydroxy acid dehydrogenase YdfG/Tfp pilus assembly protein PilF